MELERYWQERPKTMLESAKGNTLRDLLEKTASYPKAAVCDAGRDLGGISRVTAGTTVYLVEVSDTERKLVHLHNGNEYMGVFHLPYHIGRGSPAVFYDPNGESGPFETQVVTSIEIL